MNETTTDDTPSNASNKTREMTRKGGIVLTLLVAAGSILVAFQAVTSAINTWLTDRWVPVWRAIFAIGVAALAFWVLKRLTDEDLLG